MIRITSTEAAQIWSTLFQPRQDTDIPPSGFTFKDLKFAYVFDGGLKLENRHYYFVLQKDQVYSNGSNVNGLLGAGISGAQGSGNQLFKVHVLCGKKVIDLAGGYGHMMALTETGEVYVWGLNNMGQLGMGNHDSLNEPKRVFLNPDNDPKRTNKPIGEPKIIKIAAGAWSSLAIDDNSNIYEWGHRLEQDWPTPRRRAYKLTINDLTAPLIDIQATESGALVRSENEMYGWGCDFTGTLGCDTGSRVVDKPTIVKFPYHEGKIKKLISCWMITFALTHNGAIYVWGRFKHPITKPERIYLPEMVTDIVAHGDEMELWTKSGNVYIHKNSMELWRPQIVRCPSQSQTITDARPCLLRVDIVDETDVNALLPLPTEAIQRVVFQFPASGDQVHEHGQRLSCDKEKLAKTSPAFYGWLTGNWKDSDVIKMEYYSYETIQAFISYVERGECDAGSLSLEIITELHDLATQYIIEDLQNYSMALISCNALTTPVEELMKAYDSCPHDDLRSCYCYWLRGNLNETNAILLAKFAFQRNMDALLSQAARVIMETRQPLVDQLDPKDPDGFHYALLRAVLLCKDSIRR